MCGSLSLYFHLGASHHGFGLLSSGYWFCASRTPFQRKGRGVGNKKPHTHRGKNTSLIKIYKKVLWVTGKLWKKDKWWTIWKHQCVLFMKSPKTNKCATLSSLAKNIFIECGPTGPYMPHGLGSLRIICGCGTMFKVAPVFRCASISYNHV